MYYPGVQKPIDDHQRKPPSYRKSMWSQTEDQLLMNAVTRFGTNNWGVVASEVVGRTGKQCRERWAGILNPQLAKGPWTEEEDDLLKQLHAQYGNKWALISMHIKGRSTIALRNRWSWHMRHAQTLAKSGMQQKPMAQPQPGQPTVVPVPTQIPPVAQIPPTSQGDAIAVPTDHPQIPQQIPPGIMQQISIPGIYQQGIQPQLRPMMIQPNGMHTERQFY